MDNQTYVKDETIASYSYYYQESYDYCCAENFIEKEKLDFVLGVSYQKEED